MRALLDRLDRLHQSLVLASHAKGRNLDGRGPRRAKPQTEAPGAGSKESHRESAAMAEELFAAVEGIVHWAEARVEGRHEAAEEVVHRIATYPSSMDDYLVALREGWPLRAVTDLRRAARRRDTSGPASP